MNTRRRNPESALVTMILQWLKLKGIPAWRTQSVPVPLPGGGFRKFSGKKGVTDIIGLLPCGHMQEGLKDGRFLGIEVKAGKNKPTPEQEEFIRCITECGGIAFVARSLADVESMLG